MPAEPSVLMSVPPSLTRSRTSAPLNLVRRLFRTRFGGEFDIGRTIPYVLQNAPCTVWIVREPMPEEASQ